ncbi:hypothetical protein ACRYWZ_10780 [Agrobacterium deltaense]|uniref:hypothetical protein n=1 Tax=Agrobacterium deltaense TaxID=1183412 RepID=UPI003D9691DE
MLDVNDQKKFEVAVEVLSGFASETGLRTGNVAVAAAVLLHGSHRKASGSSSPIADSIFPPGEGPSISTGDLQGTCDRVWSKIKGFHGTNAEGPIFKPFTKSFKRVSSSKDNNWRNCFDLQAGLSCDAPYNPDFLLDPEFIATPRFNCPFRSNDATCQSPSGLTGGARTCFNPSKHPQPPTPDTRAAMTPKILTRVKVGGSAGYYLIKPTSGSLSGLLKDPTRRIPALAFAMALYGGSDYFSGYSSAVSLERLQSDLGLTDVLFSVLFDASTSADGHADLIAANSPAVTKNELQTDNQGVADAAKPMGGIIAFDPSVTPPTYQQKIGKVSDPAQRARLLEQANVGHNRTLRELGVYLEKRGFAELTEQFGGYDLAAKKNGDQYLFEIKTWTDINIRTQLRHGIIQLYEYRYFNGMPAETKMCLVLDRRPPSWIKDAVWKFIFEDRRVVPSWMENGTLTTFPEFATDIPG